MYAFIITHVHRPTIAESRAGTRSGSKYVWINIKRNSDESVVNSKFLFFIINSRDGEREKRRRKTKTANKCETHNRWSSCVRCLLNGLRPLQEQREEQNALYMAKWRACDRAFLLLFFVGSKSFGHTARNGFRVETQRMLFYSTHDGIRLYEFQTRQRQCLHRWCRSAIVSLVLCRSTQAILKDLSMIYLINFRFVQNKYDKTNMGKQ